MKYFSTIMTLVVCLGSAVLSHADGHGDHSDAGQTMLKYTEFNQIGYRGDARG